ncbi:MAG: ankyrin repeat domain-containing protein [Planctomycetaceae bacterium]|nr:ankyrin repeat domain-containing protein [Planctomycetaceae bacterium]
MAEILKLSKICTERDPDRDEQRTRMMALLTAGTNVDATDKNGVTALHHAVRFRNPTAVRTLIEFGADVNLPCRRSGSTPLHRAVTSTGAPGAAGRDDEVRQIVELLLSAGADPTFRNKRGKTPADYCIDSDLIQKLTTASV